ncbi:deoxyribonuclease II activity protein [Trebouxia sp. C0010 RCD-2024]
MDSITPSDTSGNLSWSLGHGWAATQRTALAETLQQLYRHNDSEVGYVMWNDEFPGGEPPEWAGGAHAKGVLGLGTATGFYLLHSVPKFPAAPCMDCPDGIGNGSYTGIALGQQLYGQSFMCASMAPPLLELLAQAIGSSGVWVYDHLMPAALEKQYPQVGALTTSPYGTASLVPGALPVVWGQALVTLGGEQLVAFAKGPTFVFYPLYEQVVEPFFQSGMLWETWQHGPGPLPQYCPALQLSQVFSFTVATVAVPGGAGWYVNQDHSKWGVTSHRVPTCCISEKQKEHGMLLPNAVCFGDLNRQVHQAYRGGGAVCFVANLPLWSAWADLVQSTEKCSAVKTLP